MKEPNLLKIKYENDKKSFCNPLLHNCTTGIYYSNIHFNMVLSQLVIYSKERFIYHTKLQYAPGRGSTWHGSDFPDVVVRFGNNPTRLDFRCGTGYIPAFCFLKRNQDERPQSLKLAE